MRTAMFRLEFRKQLPVLVGVVVIMGAWIGGAAISAPLFHWSALESLQAGALGWVVGGIPLLSLVFGANAAALLRRDTETAAEEVLPFSPGARARVALWVAYVMWSLFAGAGVLLSRLVTDGRNADLLAGMFSNLEELGLVSAILCAAVFLLMPVVAFGCTYVVRNALAGVLAAPVVVALGFSGSVALAAVYYLKAWLAEDTSPIGIAMPASIALAAFAVTGFLILSWIIGRIGRGRDFTALHALAAVGMLSVVPAVSCTVAWGGFKKQARAVAARLEVREMAWWDREVSRTGVSERPLLCSPTGSIATVDDGGTIVALHRSGPATMRQILNARWYGYDAIANGPDGASWLLRRHEESPLVVDVFRFLDGRDEPWATVSLMEGEKIWDLTVLGDNPVIIGHQFGDEAWAEVARQPGQAQRPVWHEPRQRNASARDDLRLERAARGLTALVTAQGVTWTDPATGNATLWPLQGTVEGGVGGAVAVAFRMPEGPGFVVKVDQGNRRQFAVLRPGGQVEFPLPAFPVAEKSSKGQVTGGGYFAHSDAPGAAVLLLDGAGNHYAGFDRGPAVKALSRRGEGDVVWPVLWRDGALWLRTAWRADLVKVNAQDGSVIAVVAAEQLAQTAGMKEADGYAPMAATGSGFYGTLGGQLFHVDWDGKVRHLGAAVLPD